MSHSNEQPFSISIPDTELELLHQRLLLVRFPDELDEAGWEYGAPLADIRRLVERWKSGYDWRKAEAEINTIPQFTRDIEVVGFGTLNIHYIHQRSAIESAVPLLFFHGWPGHFLEVRKMLPLLTEASEHHQSFHVVSISLPGYGWSEAPKKKGFAGPQYAEVANKLMRALGYNEYVAQGGDWGYLVSRMLASEYGQKSVKAWHTNFPVTGPPSVLEQPWRFIAFIGSLLTLPFSPADRAGLQRSKLFQEKGTGYSKEQSTQPQTLGYSLADSPVGLLAWIYEKLVTWADNYPWDDDEVLTWISIYWFSRAGPAASLRIYLETSKNGDMPMSEAKWSPIPLGTSFFSKEVMVVPRAWARAIGNVVFESDHDGGGHFAAYERPGELAADLRRLFGKGGPAFGVVSRANGYA